MAGVGRAARDHYVGIASLSFPSRDEGFLVEPAAETRSAEAEICSILIDDGDIIAPDPKVREEQVVWIQGWIDTARAVEVAAASKASIPVTGIDPKANESIRLSADQLTSLYAYGQNCGVKVFTENFRPLSSDNESPDRHPGTLRWPDCCLRRLREFQRIGSLRGIRQDRPIRHVCSCQGAISDRWNYRPR